MEHNFLTVLALLFLSVKHSSVSALEIDLIVCDPVNYHSFVYSNVFTIITTTSCIDV